MEEESLEGDTRRREEAEVRLGVAAEALERAADEAGRRAVKEDLIRSE